MGGRAEGKTQADLVVVDVDGLQLDQDDLAKWRDWQDSNQTTIAVRRQRRRHRHVAETPFARFLYERGFAYDDAGKRFYGDRGATVVRTDGIFQWQEQRDGEIVRSYWVGDWSFERGLEVPAELWNMLQERPASTSLVLPDGSDALREYTGEALREMRERGEIELYPATYRIARPPDAY